MAKGQTTAQWNGDELVINWFGIPAEEFDSGARWTGRALVFDGLAQTKAWPLANKPTPDEALRLIRDWQYYG